jgi:hypothetical protein
MTIIVNRMRDGIGFALTGAVMGYVVTCFLPPAGWALIVPVFSLLMGTRLDITLIILVAILGPAFVTVGIARLCPFPVKRWIVVCVGAVLTAGTVWTYVRWLYDQVEPGFSGPLFG